MTHTLTQSHLKRIHMNKLIDTIIGVLQNIQKLNIADKEKLAHLAGVLPLIGILVEKENHEQSNRLETSCSKSC